MSEPQRDPRPDHLADQITALHKRLDARSRRIDRIGGLDRWLELEAAARMIAPCVAISTRSPAAAGTERVR